jgi:hypothetical protein
LRVDALRVDLDCRAAATAWSAGTVVDPGAPARARIAGSDVVVPFAIRDQQPMREVDYTC